MTQNIDDRFAQFVKDYVGFSDLFDLGNGYYVSVVQPDAAQDKLTLQTYVKNKQGHLEPYKACDTTDPKVRFLLDICTSDVVMHLSQIAGRKDHPHKDVEAVCSTKVIPFVGLKTQKFSTVLVKAAAFVDAQQQRKAAAVQIVTVAEPATPPRPSVDASLPAQWPFPA